ncbi:MAG: methyltransferase [Planctomycetota bacterium]|nr:methyltransferase [Planctomycetota bacterium]MDA1250560.1 methyltransferase [Planctomycetota bacterium]
MLGRAYSWEYDWKFLILVMSQLGFAFFAFHLTGARGTWLVPEFAVADAWLAFTLISIGVALRLAGTAALSSDIMASTSPETGTLVSAGLFGLVRNPLYLGTILVMSGAGAFPGWHSALLIAAFHWLRYDRVVRHEEELLEAQLGQAYRRYLITVPRWLANRLRPVTSGRWFNLSSIPANGMFVGIWLGAIAAIGAGSFGWLPIFEIAGGATMALWFSWSGRRVPAG